MRTLALIQARMGSTRLPGKVLMDIGGRAMLERVVERVKRSRLVADIVVATSTEHQDNIIMDYCLATGVNVFRGSEADVLDRYYQAAKAFRADVVARITADCPFIDPDIIDQVIEAFFSAKADYASNTLERTFPHGLDVEVFSFAALAEAVQKATEDYEHTHVTPYIYERPELFRLHSVVAAKNNSHYRLTIDQIEDLDFARALYSRLGNYDTFSWTEAMSILEAEPELGAMNREVKQRGLQEG